MKIVFITFGDFGDEKDEFSPWAWALFFAMLIMNLIILFNFVVAVTSSAYEQYYPKRE